jgi:hypothetical protein
LQKDGSLKKKLNFLNWKKAFLELKLRSIL